MSTEVIISSRPDAETLAALYRDLHAHPELSYAESRTADIAARSLATLGYEVTTGIGGTGVVGLLKRERVLAAIERIVKAEAAASRAPREPVVELTDSFPFLVNDLEGSARTAAVLRTVVGDAGVIDPGPVTGSEDVGVFALTAGVPCVYWILGGADPALFAGAGTAAELMAKMADIPSNHSPYYAPAIQPTLTIGVAALVMAAKEWLAHP